MQMEISVGTADKALDQALSDGLDGWLPVEGSADVHFRKDL